MNSSDQDNLNQKVEKLGEFTLSLLRSFGLLRWIGYGLIILFTFDLLEILIPPDLLNPSWGFQAMGGIVERLVVILLGLVLVFYGENNFRKPAEIPVVKILSWLTLLGAICLLLLIPLGIVNPIRINQQANNQIQQATNQITEVKNEFAQVQTPEQMTALISKIDPAAQNVTIENEQQLEILKGRFEQLIAAKEAEIKQAEANRSKQSFSLLKSAVKWNLGALVSSVLLFMIWKQTSWTRKI